MKHEDRPFSEFELSLIKKMEIIKPDSDGINNIKVSMTNGQNTYFTQHHTDASLPVGTIINPKDCIIRIEGAWGRIRLFINSNN